jgi:hypothetical protein
MFGRSYYCNKLQEFMEKPWYNPFSRFIFTEKELFIDSHPFIIQQSAIEGESSAVPRQATARYQHQDWLTWFVLKSFLRESRTSTVLYRPLTLRESIDSIYLTVKGPLRVWHISSSDPTPAASLFLNAIIIT